MSVSGESLVPTLMDLTTSKNSKAVVDFEFCLPYNHKLMNSGYVLQSMAHEITVLYV